jgi:hypothetical protein
MEQDRSGNRNGRMPAGLAVEQADTLFNGSFLVLRDFTQVLKHVTATDFDFAEARCRSTSPVRPNSDPD